MFKNHRLSADASSRGSHIFTAAWRLRLQNWLRNRKERAGIPRLGASHGSNLSPLVLQEQYFIKYSESQHLRQPPIAKLPVELLCEIFVLCADMGAEAHCRELPQRAPMLLTLVCRYWREVAISLPIIWAAIWRVHRKSPLMQVWYDRSNPLPVSTVFCLSDMFPLEPVHTSNIHRWGNVRLDVLGSPKEAITAIPAHSAYALHSLTIQYIWLPDGNETIHYLALMCNTFPNLRRLDWTSNTTPSTLLNAAWLGLTHIRLKCPIPFDECLVFLSHCGEATSIELDSIRPSGPPSQSMIILPHLISFWVKFMTGGDIGTLLDHFTLPALRSLKVAAKRKTTRRNIRLLGDFFVRSSCHLELLHIEDERMPEGDLISCLRLPCLENVQELKIVSRNICDQTLALLTTPDTSSDHAGTFPYLKKIILVYVKATDGQLSRMISSRFWANQRNDRRDHLEEAELHLSLDRFYFVGGHGANFRPHSQDIIKLKELWNQELSVSLYNEHYRKNLVTGKVEDYVIRSDDSDSDSDESI